MLRLCKNKKNIGLIFGIIIAIIIWNIEITNISTDGQKAMALSLMTVVFWATGVANVGFISILYLTSLVSLNIASASDVFSLWALPTIYLVIGAYLIADAVNRSGLGERIAYLFVIKFVNSFNSIIISTFVLQIILSLLIPHPWPRAFLILSIMKVVIKSAKITKEDAVIIGFSVFVATVPTAMVFLTGDSTINMLAVDFAGQKFGWMDWFYHMGMPSLAASILTCILLLIIFKPSSTININKKAVQEKLANLGKLTNLEKKTIFWVMIAIVLWMTDSIHNVDLGWVTILIAILMSMPMIGEVLTNESWKTVPIDTLFFLNAALAIGKIGEITGMNSWIVSYILPSSVPKNIFLFGLLVVTISIGLHMILGSVIAVMSIAIPAFLAYTGSSSLNPLVPALLVYTSVAFHYLLPYQHITILVGIGEEYGMYNDSHIMKMGIPLTLVVFITVLLIQIPWWHVTGLL
ncbi:SLC13 family permease [Clostridium sp. Cult2]|uniref:SLC13 family permease n=1 Tax=Clostridium sp. Cult2 TaxID=2079003 RepID=UPI001F3723D4|nr:SLC13 family permease [Clostridium sp. Cult2]MCF6464921.1 cation transporter [Clostridium sp. Cult2]